MAQDIPGLEAVKNELEAVVAERINLNGGNFDTGEVEALRKVFDKLQATVDKVYTETVELEGRVTALEAFH